MPASSGEITLDLRVDTKSAARQVENFSKAATRGANTLARDFGRIIVSNIGGASYRAANMAMRSFSALGAVVEGVFAPLKVDRTAGIADVFERETSGVQKALAKIDQQLNARESKITALKKKLDELGKDVQFNKAWKEDAAAGLAYAREEGLTTLAEDFAQELAKADAAFKASVGKYKAEAQKYISMRTDNRALLSEQTQLQNKLQELGAAQDAAMKSATGLGSKLASLGAVLKNLAVVAGVLVIAIAALGTAFVIMQANGEQPISALDHLRELMDSLHNRVTALSVVVSAVLTTAFLGLAETVVSVANSVVSAINSMFLAIGALLNRLTGGKFSEILGQTADRQKALAAESANAAGSTGSLAKASGGAAKAARDQNKAQRELNKTLAGFDKINRLAANSANLGASGGGGGGGGGASGINALSGAAQELNDSISLLDRIKVPENLAAAFERLAEACGRFVGVVKGGLDWCWDNVLKPLGEWTMQELAPTVVEAVASALNLISAALEALSPLWDAFFNTIVAPVASFLGDVLIVALDALRLAFDAVATVIDKIVKPIFEKIGEIINETLAPIMQDLSTFLSDTLKAAWDGISDAVEGFIEWIGEVDVQPLLDALDTVAQKLQDVVGWVKSVIDWWNNLISVAKSSDPEGGGGGFSGGGGGGGGGTSGGAFGPGGITISDGTTLQHDPETYYSMEIPVRVRDETSTGLSLVETSLKKVTLASWIAKLFSKDETYFGISNANKSLKDNYKDKSINLDAANRTWTAADKGRGGLRSAVEEVNEKWRYTGNGGKVRNSLDINAVNRTWYKNGKGSANGGLKSAVEEVNRRWRYKGNGGDVNNLLNLNAANRTWTNASGGKGGLQSAVDAVKNNFKSKTIDLSGRDDTSWRVTNLIQWVGEKVAWLKVDPYIPSGKKNIRLGRDSVRFEFYAKGGFLERNSPRLAVVGDNPTQGEYILPESSLNNALQRAAFKGAANAPMGSSATTEALLRELIDTVRAQGGDIYLDGKSITRSVVNNINQQVQSTGRSPLII